MAGIALSRRIARPITGLFVPKPTRRIVFQHVPKCGGSTVNGVFKGMFRGVRFGQTVLVNDGALGDPERLAFARGARFVGGHFGPDVREDVRGDAYVFTVLRDPLDRLISTWRFRQSHRRTDYHLPFETLQDALRTDTPQVRQDLDNVIARQLGVGMDWDRAVEIPRDEWVERALAALSTMDRVIDLAELKAGLDGILAELGLPQAQDLKDRNRTDGEGRKNLAKGVQPQKVDRAQLTGLVEPWVELDRQLLQEWARRT